MGKGICNIRGSVVGVVDTNQCLMGKEFIRTTRSSLVIMNIQIKQKREKIGLIVDEVSEVEVFEKDELQEVAEIGLPVDFKYIEAMAPYKEGFIPILSLEDVVDIEFLSKRDEYEN